MRTRNHKGFALIELMTAVAILAILVAIALPLFRKLQSKAHQAETAGNMSRIHMGEQTYFAETGRYGSFDEIGFSLHGVSRLYTYRSPAAGGVGGSTGTPSVDLIVPQGGLTSPENTLVPSAGAMATATNPPTFTATATGNIDADPTMDEWHINDTKGGLGAADSDDSSI